MDPANPNGQRSADSGANGAGGNAGAGSGGKSDDGAGGKPTDAKTLAEQVWASMSPALNTAMTQRIDRALAPVSDALAKLNERLEALKPAGNGKGGDAGGGEKGGNHEGGDLAALRLRTETLERELKTERDAKAAAERKNELRREIGKHGVVDIEAVERILSPDIKVDRDGKQYGLGSGGEFVPVADFVKGEIARRPFLIRGSNARGSGPTPEANGADGKPSSTITHAEYVKRLREAPDDQRRAQIIASVARGEIAIAG